ncbi:MAG: alanine racemase [Spirochaetales bacterium]|nr:alanine racemase [Spirochaetales bacterium]
MSGPILTIDLEKLKANAERITGICGKRSVSVTGVTKVCCGMPPVARALLEGGVTSLGESRMENIYRLRASGVTSPVMLLRIPPLSAVEEIVTNVDVSLNSELSVIQALSSAALERGLIHKIILMVDLGDLREGIWPGDLLNVVSRVVDMPGVKIAGIGTNLTCYGGVLPSVENMGALAGWADQLEGKFSLDLEWVSGGNSSAIPLLLKGKMPSRINNLRIGEAIMLGRETAYGEALTGFSRNVFSLNAELIEIKTKPSLPIGDTGMDAFGGKPFFTDKGELLRGILNVGREDVAVDGLIPEEPNLSILGASSDHLLVDLTAVTSVPEVGDRISFSLNYGALLAAMTSSYVLKQPVFPGGVISSPRSVSIFGKLSSHGRKCLRRAVEDLDLNIVKSEKVDLGRFTPLLAGRRPLLTSALADMETRSESLGLIMIDSTPSLGLSGKLPLGRRLLSTSLGLIDPEINFSQRLSPENIVLLGVKKADPDEASLIRKLNIKTFTMEDVDLLGIREVTMRSIRRAASGTGGIILRFSRRAAGPQGLTSREFHFMLEILAGSDTIRCLDISGYPMDSEICQFVETALGKKILGR